MTDQKQLRGYIRSLDDPQAIHTRRRLQAAYRAAADERVQRVSVRWLCERSGVGRSTFYTHFSSVEDLAAFTITEDFDQLAADDAENRAHGISGEVVARAALTQMVRVLNERQELLHYTFTEASAPTVIDRLMSWVSTYTHLELDAANNRFEEPSFRVVVEFASAGIVRSILSWIDTSGDVSEGELVELLLSLLPTVLRDGET